MRRLPTASLLVLLLALLGVLGSITAVAFSQSLVRQSPTESFPPNLDAVIANCLHKSIAKRYQTVADLARDLAPYASDVGRASAARIESVSERFFGLTPRSVGPSSAPTPDPGSRIGVDRRVKLERHHQRCPRFSIASPVIWPR